MIEFCVIFVSNMNFVAESSLIGVNRRVCGFESRFSESTFMFCLEFKFSTPCESCCLDY